MKQLQFFSKYLKQSTPLIITFFYPFIILLIFGAFYIPTLWSYYKELLGFGLFTWILLTITLAFKSIYIRKYSFIFCSVLLTFLICVKLYFYQQYGVKISTSALYVIFESNRSEISGYFSDFLDTSVFLLVLTCIVLFSIYLNTLFLKKYSSRLNTIPSFYFRNKLLKLGVILSFILSGYLIYKKLSNENILLETYYSYQEYKALKTNLKNTLAKETNNHINVTSSFRTPQTYIVIIGESTSRRHMQLYGYHRETNPLLTEIQDEILLFDDVIAPHVHTLLSLKKALTLSDYKNPSKLKNSSIVQLANQAGFTTYWLSNQQPIGYHESIPTILGNAANKKYFVNTDDYGNDVYDEKLLPYLDKVLEEKTSKKVVFIHLMGTHGPYKRRYPKEFDYFSGQNGTSPYKHQKSIKQVNEYDNAIRYNDSIIRSVIEKVRIQNTSSYVLYFSDHGEEVYDTMDFLGHNEYHATKPMYEVPFIVWLSQKYKVTHPNLGSKNNLTHRSYNLENLIHSFSNLSDIKFNKFDSTQSIFNINFKEKQRLIKNGIDYDKN